MLRPTLIFFVMFFMISCSHHTNEAADLKYEKQKWITAEGDDYPFREAMLGGIRSSDTLRGMTKPAVINMLGEPTRSDSNYLFYRISQTRAAGFPLHTKTLVVRFAGDSIVNGILIHE